MKTKSNLLRCLAASLMELLRRAQVVELNLMLAGFGVPVCSGQLTAVRRKKALRSL